jgi:uncharacterized protein YyaL (SSP411 family)
MDKLQPSTNAVSASNLFRLGTLLANAEYISLAKATISAFEAEILQHPWLFASLLTGVVAAKLGVKEVKLAADDKEGLRKYYTLPRAEARALILTSTSEKEAEPAALPLESKPVSGEEENKAHAVEMKETQAQAEPTLGVADAPVATAGEPKQLDGKGEEKPPAAEPAPAAVPENKEVAETTAPRLTEVPK